ncbi:HD-GYP domain-containing protein [Coralloluteibacterium stylophorae]|uniref:DUF3391 domain-containing protein n=1 Tax=Coralloluteibacterium stylophorae TaxID=1776034 RepID=A0A8J7VTU1_9GAMM|nr:HD-GYP domain-containing protein [Coralloluteibacterium stylophorae]MBS7456502.1 DUF3391 domain-containing protein [Coralloluteibacterium stylophorae]
MGIEERRVELGDLAIGMYVCRLDRDWTDTPYPLQGFLLNSQEDIRELRRHCAYVYVDAERSGMEPLKPPPVARPRRVVDTRPRDYDELKGRVRYADTASVEEEAPRARQAYDAAATATARIIDDVRSGQALSLDDVDDAVEPVMRSILRSADAFMWIESLRQRSSYAYSHAINCSALAAMYGRHMGFPEDVLLDMAAGALLLDIGTTQLPESLLAHAGPLSRDGLDAVRAHVEAGLRIVEQGEGRNPHIVEMVRGHHERDNGSGYPDALFGAQIPLLARIAGVIDSFDAMTSDRPYRKALGRHEALQELYRQRDQLYQGEVVEQFMQCLSIYPTGSLVELNTGEVAIVMAQNPARRLRPRVMLLTTPDKAIDESFRVVDLLVQPAEGDEAVRVVRALEPGAYGIDPAELYL